jgi:hypothetical protein
MRISDGKAEYRYVVEMVADLAYNLAQPGKAIVAVPA